MSPTERELQVLVAVVEHSSEKAAARTLGISPRTVADHLQVLYERIGAIDRTNAVWLLWPMLRHRLRLPGDERRVAQRRAA